MFRIKLVLFSLFLLMGLLSPLFSSAAQANEAEAFAAWLVDFRVEAAAAGISQATLDRALTGIKPLPRVVEQDRSQPEVVRTLDDYLANAINDQRIIRGRQLLRTNWRTFTQTDREFAVQSRFLVALWAIETNFGVNQGNVPVVQALVTLAYDRRRSSYFRQELLNALRILERGMIPLAAMKGSWAGALGQVQFMPSVYLKYAVDFDGDGKVDIQGSRADALASAANYLTQIGWQKGWTWGREVQVPADFDPALNGLDLRLPLAEWQKLGLRQRDGAPLPTAEISASLIRPDGPQGRSFLVYDNYRRLLNWNRSHKFAIAVGLLADQIGK